MFNGEYECVLDDKGRLSLPARFREVLRQRYDSRLILTTWFDNCLVLLPYEEWEKIALKIKGMTSLTRRKDRAIQRLFFANSNECELDKQGRLMIPQRLRRMRNLNKHVVLIGMGDMIEIWAKEEYERYKEEIGVSLEELVEEIDGLQL